MFGKKSSDIAKEQITKALEKLNKKRDDQEKEAVEKVKKDLMLRHEHELAEKNAIIDMHEREIAFLKAQIEHQQKASETNYRDSKTNVRIATELKSAADKLLMMSGQAYKEVQSLYDETDRHNMDIEKRLEIKSKK